jgi:DNA-binding NarL/FixJ family response regulator
MTLEPSLTVLVVHDDAMDVALVRDQLSNLHRNPPIGIEWVCTLSAAIARLARNDIDAVLLGLTLPDSPGLQAVERLCAVAPLAPVLVFSADGDEQLGLHAVKHGAQDYLIKGKVDGALIDRALRYAIERKRAERVLARVASVMAGLCYECGRKVAADRPPRVAGN